MYEQSGKTASRFQSLAQFRRWLESLADAQAVIPAGVALERLPGGSGGAGDVTTDLSAEQAAGLLDRSPSTVRGWCREGALPGAYRRRGREWRIPLAALDALREGDTPRRRPPDPGRAVDLGGWREELEVRS